MAWFIDYSKNRYQGEKIEWESDLPCCGGCLAEKEVDALSAIDDACCCTHANGPLEENDDHEFNMGFL